MNGQQLKNSILQLAIQGKLVPQDPHDEPASVLLAKIREEKEQMVKDKKLKKKDLISTPISEDEKPFEIPESWEWVKLAELIFGTNAGKSPNCEKKPKSDNRWGVLTTTSIQNGFFLPEGNKILPDSFIVKNEHIVHYGDVLITRAGPRNRTGIVCVVNRPCDNLILSDKTVRIEYSHSNINPYLVMYFLNSESLHEYIMKATVGMAASQVNISQENIQSIIFPLPPLAEQHRIVEKIEQLMPLVDEYDKAQSELNNLNQELSDRLKKSILQEAIMGKLGTNDPNDEPASELLKRIREEKEALIKAKKIKKEMPSSAITDEEKPFDIPENWEWVTVKDLCCFALPNKQKGKYVCMDAKYLRGKGEHVYLDSGNYVEKSKPIILVDGENSGEFFITPNEGYLGSTFKELFISQEICFDYINFIFLLLKDKMRNNKKGAAIPHLDKILFFSSLVPLPPLAEQHRIVEKLETILPKLDILQKETQK